MDDAHDNHDVETIPHHKPTGKYSTGEPVWSGGSATTNDVIAEIQQRAQKHLPLYPKILDELPTVKIFNIWNERYTIHKGSLGTFTILECEGDAPYSKPLEIPCILREASAYAFDGGGTQFQWLLHDGRDVANDIIGNNFIYSPLQNLMRWGVFVAKGETPTSEEIEEAHSQLRKSCSGLVLELREFLMSSDTLIDVTPKHIKALDWMRSQGGKITP